ncbi:MAG: hypothetical protein VX438_16095, partial [Planctomycetota bacterium]|nr:hypothetical protein [Planctomycetota bacterium]
MTLQNVSQTKNNTNPQLSSGDSSVTPQQNCKGRNSGKTNCRQQKGWIIRCPFTKLLASLLSQPCCTADQKKRPQHPQDPTLGSRVFVGVPRYSWIGIGSFWADQEQRGKRGDKSQKMKKKT